MTAAIIAQVNRTTGRIDEYSTTLTPVANGVPGLDSSGHLTVELLPTGMGPETNVLVCSEDLVAGNWVSFHDVAGTPKVRKANATDASKPAQGFVLESFTSGDLATVYCDGQNSGLSGLTAGTRYFLSAATSGANTATPPSATGNLLQLVGVAMSATTVLFRPDDGTVLA